MGLNKAERLFIQFINALAETIDAKDSYTNGHSVRVAQYSVQIAERAGKSIPEIFAEYGEKEFRRIEAEVVADICKEKLNLC